LQGSRELSVRELVEANALRKVGGSLLQLSFEILAISRRGSLLQLSFEILAISRRGSLQLPAIEVDICAVYHRGSCCTLTLRLAHLRTMRLGVGVHLAALISSCEFVLGRPRAIV
jgi:hypothetical protein